MATTGIPFVERLVGSLMIRSHCRKNPPAATLGIVRRQRDDLAGLIARAEAAEAGRASRRVRIKRLPGMEASSTEWSLAMVAQHLAVTNAAMARTIGLLTRGERDTREVRTADFKPTPDARAAEAMAALDASIEDLAGALSDVGAVERATLTHAHPWFGELTAAKWACFPSFHQAVHLKQAGLIARGLGA